MVVEKDKQLKVDNWGSFFLHRLSLLYKKEEKCDGTLLFKDGKSLKVHRLVLMTCTDYFDEQLWTNNTFTLPPVLGHDDVKPIIDFMYTGFLNFNAEIRHGVFTAAKFLNVTILMKLLHAQSDDSPSQVEVKPPPPLEPITTIITNNATSSTSSLSSTSTPSSSTSSLPSTSSSLPSTSSSLPSTSSSAPLASSSAASSSTSSVVRNLMKVKKLPKAAKPLLLTPQPSSSSISVVTVAPTSQSVPGKKLPFWKKRTTVIGGGTVVAGGVVERGPRLPPDYYGGADDGLPPLPSRCELEEVLELAPRDECPTFPSIDSVPVLQPRQQSTQQIVNEFYKLNNKRPTPTCAGMREDDVTESEMDIDDDLDETCTEPLAMEETILLSSARKRPAPSGGGGSGGSAEEKFDKLARLAGTPPKPILKPLAHDTVSIGGGGSSSKKVRFSLVADGKENSGSANSVPAMATSGVAPPTTTTVATPLLKSVPLIGAKTDQLVTSRVSITGDTSAALNPTAIISELMKKNPDLMRKNKNIRVSIVGGGGGQAAAAEKGAATKVRYIVMKQQLGTGGKGGKASTPSNAENTTGPWLCEECGEPGKPEQFETYYLYRRHLHNVHQVRIDARICEYCGYKSSKRNLHLYHLYTKHSVPPPRNIRFPKCDKCNYIALSDSLLIKHNNNHGLNSDKLSCKACVLVFKTQAALTNHQQTCPHRNKDPLTAQTSPSPTKEYNCDYCHKIFNRSINLKAHMRIAHKNESPLRRYDEEEEEAAVVEGGTAAIVDSTASGNLLQVIRLPVVEASGEEGGVLFLASEGGDVATPASESGHQTVILLDGTSELVFESGSGAVMLQPTPQDGSTGASGCTEYIVPEVISAANQLFAHATADQQHETVEGALPEGTSLIVVPSDDQLTDEGQTVLQTETQLTADEGGTPAGQVAADSNCAAADQDTCINIVEEACKRETIIIETSSVIESGGSVIVSAPASAPAAAPAGPRSLDLAKDWDDVEANAGDSRGPTSGSDDQRPSRATFDGIEESILPDMI